MSEATIPMPGSGRRLPRPIGRALGRLGLKIRVAAMLGGLGTTAMVLAVVAALGMAADFLWDLTQTARWAIWAAWILAAAVVLIRTVLRPLVRRLGVFDLAASVEQGHPELGENLTGAVALLDVGTPHGSPELIAALADQAARSCRTVRARTHRAFARALLRLVLGAALISLIVAPALMRPGTFGVLARRFLMPWADLDRLPRLIIEVEPGDRVVAAGSDVAITATVRPLLAIGPVALPETAQLVWTEPADGQARSMEMSTTGEAASSPRFAMTMPRVHGTIDYRVTSGRASSRPHRLNALEPPAPASITARVEPPAYAKRPAIAAADPARIVALEGSRITLEIAASRRVASAEVGWPSESGKPAVVPLALSDGGRKGTAELRAEASGAYTLAMRDEHGIDSRPDDSRRIIVTPDAPPEVATRGVEDLKEVNPRDTVSVGFAAKDDIAVASVEVHYNIRRGSVAEEKGQRTIDAKGLGSTAARGVAALPLAPLGLKPGDLIAYRLRVADNRPAPKGPNVTWSSVKELTVTAAAETIAERLARLRRSAIRATLDAIDKQVAAGRQEAERLRQAADAARRGREKWGSSERRAVEEREKTLRDLIERLLELARSLAEDPSTRELSRPARQVAELEAESARATLERARHEEDPSRREEALKQVGDRMAKVAERLGELRRGLDAQDRERERRGKLRELADRQQRLADELDGSTPRGRAEVDRVRSQQEAVRHELDDLVRQTPDLRGALLDAAASDADRLARDARDLAARQREEASKAGDLSPHAAELKALADAQRRLEDDARRLAMDVDAPLAENGRAGLNVEAVRQAADPIERGDVDQARQRLEGAENELRRLARDIEDIPDDPRAMALRLFRRQDALNREIAEAVPQLREKDKLGPQEKKALDERLKTLGAHQQAIAELTATIRPPSGPRSREKFPADRAREAAEKTKGAAEAFRNPDAQTIDGRKNEARQALERLANELPDPWRRNEPNRQKFDEARRIAHDLFNQVEQHLRETEPRPGHLATSDQAAEELSKRLGDAPDRMDRAVKALAEMEPEPRAEPHRDRAVREGEAMGRVLRDLQKADARGNARAAIPAAVVRARAAMERLQQQFNNGVPDDIRADELARDQRDLVGRLAEGDAAGLGEDQRRIAVALRGVDAPDAALERAEAIRQAEQAAEALGRSAGPEAVAAAKGAAEAIDALADRLAGRQSPRDRIRALARAERALNRPEALANPSATAERQRTIAAELALLPGTGDAGAAIADATAMDRRAAEIDEQPGASRPSPDDLAAAHRRAAEALDAIAERASKDPEKVPAPKPGNNPAGGAGPDPELALTTEQSGATRDLVRRQRQLRERFLAVLGRHVGPQESIRRESVAMGRDLIELRDRIRPIGDRAVYPAFEASHQFRGYASPTMEQAEENLAKGQLPQARDTQRRASENVERGALLAEEVAAALRAERMALGGPPPDSAPQAGKPLTSARSEIARASRQLERNPGAPEVRAAMQAAARELMSAAVAAEPAAAEPIGFLAGDGDEPSNPTNHPPGGSPDDSKTQLGRRAEVDLAALKEAIRRGTGRTWGELPGHLRTEILQSARGQYRDDYARLIQLYFREIAAESPR